MLDTIPITYKSKDLMLRFLCSESGEYLTIKEVAAECNQRQNKARDDVLRFSKYIHNRFQYTKSWKTLLLPINHVMDLYKGAITIDTYVQIGVNEYKRDAVDLKRALRLLEMTTNMLKVDTSKEVFWGSKSQCVRCTAFRQAFNNSRNDIENTLKDIDENCKIIDCIHRQGKLFDYGQHIFHVREVKPKNIVVAEKDSIVKTEIQKQNEVAIDRYLKIIRSDIFNKDEEAVLNKILSSGNYVLKTELERFARLSNIQLSDVIQRINRMTYDSIQYEAIMFDSSNNSWSIPDHVFPLLINQEIVMSDNEIRTQDKSETIDNVKNTAEKFETEYNEEVIPEQFETNENTIVVSRQNEINLNQDFMMQHEAMLENTLSKAMQSYKFYWAQTLFHCIEQGMNTMTKRQAAAFMCAFAWGDVLKKDFKYRENDHIPIVVDYLYSNSFAHKYSDFDSIYNESEQFLSNEDIAILVNTVAIYFNQTYMLDIDHEQKDYDSLNKFLYVMQEGIIFFNNKQTQKLKGSVDRFNLIIQQSKENYFKKIKQNGS